MSKVNYTEELKANFLAEHAVGISVRELARRYEPSAITVQKTGNVKPSPGHASPGQPCRTLCIVCRRPKPSPSDHLGTHDSSHRRNTGLIQPIHLPDSYANTAVNRQNSIDKIILAQSPPPTSKLQTIVEPLWTIKVFRSEST